jgi:hypothetical protein
MDTHFLKSMEIEHRQRGKSTRYFLLEYQREEGWLAEPKRRAAEPVRLR